MYCCQAVTKHWPNGEEPAEILQCLNVNPTYFLFLPSDQHKFDTVTKTDKYVTGSLLRDHFLSMFCTCTCPLYPILIFKGRHMEALIFPYFLWCLCGHLLSLLYCFEYFCFWNSFHVWFRREKTRLEQLQQEQKVIEERNKRKKALLAKTIAEKWVLLPWYQQLKYSHDRIEL